MSMYDFQLNPTRSTNDKKNVLAARESVLTLSEQKRRGVNILTDLDSKLFSKASLVFFRHDGI